MSPTKLSRKKVIFPNINKEQKQLPKKEAFQCFKDEKLDKIEIVREELGNPKRRRVLFDNYEAEPIERRKQLRPMVTEESVERVNTEDAQTKNQLFESPHEKNLPQLNSRPTSVTRSSMMKKMKTSSSEEVVESSINSSHPIMMSSLAQDIGLLSKDVSIMDYFKYIDDKTKKLVKSFISEACEFGFDSLSKYIHHPIIRNQARDKISEYLFELNKKNQTHSNVKFDCSADKNSNAKILEIIINGSTKLSSVYFVFNENGKSDPIYLTSDNNLLLTEIRLFKLNSLDGIKSILKLNSCQFIDSGATKYAYNLNDDTVLLLSTSENKINANDYIGISSAIIPIELFRTKDGVSVLIAPKVKLLLNYLETKPALRKEHILYEAYVKLILDHDKLNNEITSIPSDIKPANIGYKEVAVKEFDKIIIKNELKLIDLQEMDTNNKPVFSFTPFYLSTSSSLLNNSLPVNRLRDLMLMRFNAKLSMINLLIQAKAGRTAVEISDSGKLHESSLDNKYSDYNSKFLDDILPKIFKPEHIELIKDVMKFRPKNIYTGKEKVQIIRQCLKLLQTNLGDMLLDNSAEMRNTSLTMYNRTKPKRAKTLPKIQ